MTVYYNENDPYCVEWLGNLMRAGHIPEGDIDDRDIREVSPDDLKGYDHAHFFAGIGGWPYALNLAGWTGPVWTGSCPCQPLSSAGQRKGHADERHLWPAFYALIAERRPAAIFGEQVASKDGREWFAGVRADLEDVRYAVGAADLPAACVRAPHKRARLFWVADADGGNASAERIQRSREHGQRSQDDSGAQRLGDTAGEGLQGQWREYRPGGERCSGLAGLAVQAGVPQWNGPTIAVKCSDGSRRVSAQSDAFPLAHGVSARMGKLRGAGNAIIPQVAAEFVQAYQEAIA